jgi:hypothetical protein
MRCVIGVTTCHLSKYAPKVLAQRETWVPDAKGVIDVRFIHCGTPTSRPFLLDEVFCNGSDSYMGRPSKIRGMCQWALHEGYDYVLKTDDDVYIDIPVLMRTLVIDGDYMGRACFGGIKPTDKNEQAPFASGFAYWLSRRAMQVIADAPDPGDALEDRWVGNLLYHAGIELISEPDRFIACYPGIEPVGIWRLPATKHGACFCEFPPVKMRELHAINVARRQSA